LVFSFQRPEAAERIISQRLTFDQGRGHSRSKGGKVKAKDSDGKPIEITRNATAARWTFVIGKDGKIAYKNAKVTPALDAKAITEFIAKAEGK